MKLTTSLDAEVIYTGAAAPTEHGASHIVRCLGEITLIQRVTSTQAPTEIARNLAGACKKNLAVIIVS